MNQYLHRLTEQQDQQYGDDQSSAASAGLGIILGVGALFMLPFMFSDATGLEAGSKNNAHLVVLWEAEHNQPYALLDEKNNLLWAGEWNSMPIALSVEIKRHVDKNGQWILPKKGSKASILPTDPNRDEAIMALWDYAFYNGYSLGSWGPMTGTRWFPVTLKGSPAGDVTHDGYALGAADNIRRLLSHEPEGLGLRGSPLDFTESVIWKLGPPITKDERNYILKFLKNHTTF